MWRMSKDGDTFEKRWAHRVCPQFPELEQFWAKHVVPLTFRDAPDELRSKYIRPSVKSHFIDYADANYATFFHLAQCFYWRDQVEESIRAKEFGAKSDPIGTEAIYCFFSHAVSAHDSAAQFADSVNTVAKKYLKQHIFQVRRSEQHSGDSKVIGINGIIGGPNLRRLHAAVRATKEYRNLVVHERIVYLQNGYLPTKRIKDYAGLRTLGRFARDYQRWSDEGQFEEFFHPAVPTLDSLLDRLISGLRPIWRTTTSVFDRLERDNRDFDNRKIIAQKDRCLSEDAFKRARSLGT